MYGLVTPTGTAGEVAPAKKPTKFMSNSWCILQELSVRCDGSHVHQHLVGGRAAKAQEYPDALCRAICRGLANQKRYDESGQVCSGKLGLNSLKSFLNTVNARGENHISNPLRTGHPYPQRLEPEPSCRGSNIYDSFPNHWRDDKHEEDGTERRSIETCNDGKVVQDGSK